MSSLLEDIKSYKVDRNQCSMQSVLKTLGKEDLKDLEAAMADMAIPGTFIARALQARGLDIKDNTVNRHRRHVCSCT